MSDACNKVAGINLKIIYTSDFDLYMQALWHLTSYFRIPNNVLFCTNS